MVYMRLLLLVTLTASITPAAELCIRNEAGLDAQTLMLTMHHIRGHQELLGVDFVQGCSASSIRLTFRAVPQAPHPQDALGATRVTAGKVQPEILIFAKSILQMLQGASAECKARALAKVVAHELSHYLRQKKDHGEGLDRRQFDAEFLTSF